MKTEFQRIVPILPSANIARDVEWYKKQTGFEAYYQDHMYAVLFREEMVIHLQWHADTKDDPLLGGSVIRIVVNEIQQIFDEFVGRGTIAKEALKLNTPWQTNEFGFNDLNRNAVFITADLQSKSK